jgi:hypothetical protein
VMIAVHDIRKAKQQYSDLLGATFMDVDWTGAPFRINVAIAWDAGIELCAPMPGREKDSAISQFLSHRGEGVTKVFSALTMAPRRMIEPRRRATVACIRSIIRRRKSMRIWAAYSKSIRSLP